MTLAHWLWLGAASLTLLLGLGAARRALTPRRAPLLLPHIQAGKDLYRCDRCGFLVGSSSHVDPYTGDACGRRP